MRQLKDTERFTFDRTWSVSGVDLIMVVLGLFAISQALLLLVDKGRTPGEALTAMMLSVFYVHNVIPGPQHFAGQLDFTVALYIALTLLNVIMLGFLLCRPTSF